MILILRGIRVRLDPPRIPPLCFYIHTEWLKRRPKLLPTGRALDRPNYPVHFDKPSAAAHRGIMGSEMQWNGKPS